MANINITNPLTGKEFRALYAMADCVGVLFDRIIPNSLKVNIEQSCCNGRKPPVKTVTFSFDVYSWDLPEESD